jgi:tRNA-dihydrouridine synthase B
MLKIGTVELENPIIPAPLAGISDPPFRRILKAYRPGLVCSEMVSAMALHFNSARTRDELLVIDPAEHPISIQIFGSDPAIMAEAARFAAACGADIIDINMGCPVPKVIKNGDGAALLNNLPLAGRIIAAVVQSVKLPVTVKCRLGWSGERIVAPELAEIAADNGAAAIMVHARTREQFYHGKADWSWIKVVKERVAIPVIGNGSVDSPQSAARMVAETGCDGVMIGQALLGRPWLIGQTVAHLSGGEMPADPSLAERFRIIHRHFDWQLGYAGAERGVKQMRKHLAWYFKGLPGAARMRGLVNGLITPEAVIQALEEYEAELIMESIRN